MPTAKGLLLAAGDNDITKGYLAGRFTLKNYLPVAD